MSGIRKTVLTGALAAIALVLGVLPASAHDATPGWLSGMGGDDPVGFGTFRGSPVEIREVWMNSPDLWNLAPGGELHNYKGPLSASITVPTWTSWHDVAKGKQDKVWRATAKQLKAYRKGAAVTYVSPFWEFNGDWADWSVTRTSQGKKDFRDGFARLSKIMRHEMPEVKIILPAHCHRSLPKGMMPPRSSYDVQGCTVYNSWLWSPDGAVSMADLENLRKRAVATKKPMAITEWGNCSDPDSRCGGGEAPAYMDRMYAWAKKNAGKGKGRLLFETYYNIEPQYQLVDEHGCMTTTQPATARAYARNFGKALVAGDPRSTPCPEPTTPPPSTPTPPTPPTPSGSGS